MGCSGFEISGRIIPDNDIVAAGAEASVISAAVIFRSDARAHITFKSRHAANARSIVFWHHLHRAASRMSFRARRRYGAVAPIRGTVRRRLYDVRFYIMALPFMAFTLQSNWRVILGPRAMLEWRRFQISRSIAMAFLESLMIIRLWRENVADCRARRLLIMARGLPPVKTRRTAI